MKTFEIISENNGRYVLQPKDSILQRQMLMFEFWGIDKPQAGDEISLDEKLLDTKSELFAQPYAFEVYIPDKGVSISEQDSAEYVVVSTSNKTHLMKRIYG